MAQGVIFASDPQQSRSTSSVGSSGNGSPTPAQGDEKMNRDPVQEGHHDAVKEATKDEDKGVEHFEKVVEKSQQPLYQLSTVFPFVLFTDHIAVDLSKVTIVFNFFFRTQRVHSVYIEDITDIYVETSLFFAALSIVDKGFVENEIKIRYLPRAKAIKARRIIQGLVVAKRQGIDLSKLDNIPDLIAKLEQIGEAHSPH